MGDQLSCFVAGFRVEDFRVASQHLDQPIDLLPRGSLSR